MGEIAEQHADALEDEFSGPVDVLGMSSGGSVALQLAADRPDAVGRLVIAGAGYRLGKVAGEAQLLYAEAAAHGRRGADFLAPLKVGSKLGALFVTPLMWVLDPLTRPMDPSDMVAFARASSPSTSVGGSATSVRLLW